MPPKPQLVAILLMAATLGAPAARAQTPPAPSTLPAPRMDPTAHPSFAVAAIKLHDPSSPHQGFDAKGDRLLIRNETVAGMLQFAYAIHPHQIVNAPDWLTHDAFDIEGTSDTEGEPSLHQMQEMIQQLLADRFQLKFHRDTRELSVYALRVAKGGPKLKPAADPNAQPDQNANGHSSDLTQIYTSCSIADFILGMQFFVEDRPLIDQTGLTGRYDITLHYSPEESTSPNAPPGLFTALQEQLGLKLDPVKAPTPVFVIDHVDHPSAN